MRALLLEEVGELAVVDLDPPLPGPGEVVVEVAAAGVCGSDIHSARDGGLLRVPPIVMGHEFAGTVEGRRVAVHPILSCGSCDLCARGLAHLCRNRSIVGIQRPGGFAEAVAVPESALVDLPDHVSFQAAAMIEPLAVALHAVRLGDPGSDDRVAVLGSGTIGLLITMLCADRGVAPLVVDLQPRRLEHAREVGAGAVASQVEGEFDVVFDAAGVPATHRASLAALRPGGTAVWVGNESPEAGFDAQVLVRAEHRVLGSAAYTRRDFEDAAAMVDDRVLAWVNEERLESGAEVVYRLMDPAPDGPIKVLLVP